MFFLKKFIGHLLLPPGLLIAVFLLIAFLTRKKIRLVQVLSLLSAFILYAISIEPVKDFLIKPLESSFKRPTNLRGNIIVVLGGGIYDIGELKESSFKRTVKAYILHKRTGAPLVLSGGSVSGKVPESLIMKRLLLELGVEEKAIHADTKSKNTMENALFVREICKKISCSSVILVTSAFHMRRAVRTFSEFGFDVQPYPVDFRYDGDYTIYSYIPKYSVFKDSVAALREYMGILYYNTIFGFVRRI